MTVNYLHTSVDGQDVILFTANKRGRIVGTLRVVFYPQGPHIESVYVAPQHRRKGYAYRMVIRVLFVIPTTHPYITLTVKDDNLAAIKCYEKVGFAWYGNNPHQAGFGDYVHHF